MTSAGLSILFLVVYSGCNWITARRDDVGLIHFQWERYIPFVPLMIVPYMSIDLFFIAAPFLFRTNRALSTFARRVTLAIIAAGICFLLFPFRFAFPRPHADGWIGALFDWFREMDGPYNLFPSLHVVLCLLLANAYASNTRGLVRTASKVWFVFIGLSAVLTYQHHVLDVAGGIFLAICCFYFIPESSQRLPVSANRRLAIHYATGSVAAAMAGFALWPWGSLLLWPAIALGLVAGAYFGFGPSIFRKSGGQLPISTRLLLAPYLIGQRISLLYYGRQCRAWNEITPQVWIGRVLDNRAANAAVGDGVTAVLDLTAEFSEAKPFRSLSYRNIPILDLTAPTTDQLKEISDFIIEHSRSGIVYVHCKIGYSRSAAAVAAYLLAAGMVGDVNGALALIRRARPSVIVRPEVISALVRFSARLESSVVF